MTIHIENLRFQCIIGILDFERKNLQDIVINSTLSYRYKKDFINYVDIVEIIKNEMINGKFLLIEDALNSVCKKILKNYKHIKKMNLKITKPSILSDCQVSVSTSYKNKS